MSKNMDKGDRLMDAPIPILTRSVLDVDSTSTGRQLVVHDGPKFLCWFDRPISLEGSKAATKTWLVNVSTSPLVYLSPPRIALHRSQLKAELVSLLSNLVTTPMVSESGVIRAEVAVSAIRLLSLLPDECRLPTVAPDHEGGLLLVWEGIEPEVIVTLEEDALHFVVHPGTERAEYFEDLKFADTIPKKLLSTLPVSALA